MADDPVESEETVPMERELAGPVAPVAPVGRPRFSVCVGAVPVMEAVAAVPTEREETVPIESVLAGPVAPVFPFKREIASQLEAPFW